MQRRSGQETRLEAQCVTNNGVKAGTIPRAPLPAPGGAARALTSNFLILSLSHLCMLSVSQALELEIHASNEFTFQIDQFPVIIGDHQA